MKENSKYYIDNAELEAEMRAYQASSDDPAQRTPSERLGELLLLMHKNILRHANFRNYREDLKEEMASFSVYRILKNGLKSFKFGMATPFSYFSRAIFNNFYTVLSRYYKRMNGHRAYVKGCLAKLQDQGFHNVDEILRNFRVYGEGDGED